MPDRAVRRKKRSRGYRQRQDRGALLCGLGRERGLALEAGNRSGRQPAGSSKRGLERAEIGLTVRQATEHERVDYTIDQYVAEQNGSFDGHDQHDELDETDLAVIEIINRGPAVAEKVEVRVHAGDDAYYYAIVEAASLPVGGTVRSCRPFPVGWSTNVQVIWLEDNGRRLGGPSYGGLTYQVSPNSNGAWEATIDH